MTDAAIPARIICGPYRYAVHIDEQRVTESSVRGTTNHLAGRIMIAGELCQEHRRKTLLHEVLHCCAIVTQERNAKLTEEEWIGKMAAILLDTLQRNPELVAYLTADGDESQ